MESFPIANIVPPRTTIPWKSALASPWTLLILALGAVLGLIYHWSRSTPSIEMLGAWSNEPQISSNLENQGFNVNDRLCKQGSRGDLIFFFNGTILKAYPWNWKAINPHMEHECVPPAHIDSILALEPEIDASYTCLFSTGRGYGNQLDNSGDGVIQVSDNLRNHFKNKKIEFLFQKTEPTVRLVNEYISREQPFIAFLHATC